MRNALVIIFSVLLLSSCAKRVTVSYGSVGDNTGTIKIKPSSSIRKASITMDGRMLWERKRRIKSLTVINVPKGGHDINVVSDSWYYKDALNDKQTVNITGNGDNRAVLVSVPPYSTGYYIYMSAIIIVCLLPSITL